MEECEITLKNCYNDASTSSMIKRRHIFSILLPPCIQRQDLAQAHLKAIAKILTRTVFIYSDNVSRNLVMQALKKFLSSNGANAADTLLAELDGTAKVINKTGHSLSFAKTALTLLVWCKIICETVHEGLKDESFAMLSKVSAVFYARASSAENEKLARKAFKTLTSMWRSHPDVLEKCFDKLLEVDMYQVEALSYASICIRFFTEEKEMKKVHDKKGKLLETYLKLFINTKTLPNLKYMYGIKFLLKHVNHETFKDLMLPSIQKSILRNPEIIIPSVSKFLNHVTIDLSQYAEEIGKSLSSHLVAQNDQLRSTTVDAFGNLSKQCSDVDAIGKLIDVIGDVFYSSEGKLTSVDQKHSVIQALHAISNNAVSGKSNREKLAHQLYNKVLKFLETEGHEGILCESLKMLSVWTYFISENVPSTFPGVLKRAFTSKSSTSLVRTMYLQVAASIYKGNTLSDGIPLIDLFLNSFQKAKGQAHVAQAVTESLTAGIVLEKFAALDDDAISQKLQPVFSLSLDNEKQFFTSDKFLTSATQFGYEQLIVFYESSICKSFKTFL